MQQSRMRNHVEADREYVAISIAPGFAISEFVSHFDFFSFKPVTRMCVVIQGLGYAQGGPRRNRGGEASHSKQPTRIFGLIGKLSDRKLIRAR